MTKKKQERKLPELRVVLRKEKATGSIIALYPDIPEDYTGWRVAGYSITDQHHFGACREWVNSETVPMNKYHATIGEIKAARETLRHYATRDNDPSDFEPVLVTMIFTQKSRDNRTAYLRKIEREDKSNAK